MISERILSTRYTSFWAELLPWGEKFARLVNLSYERYENEFEWSPLGSSERALVNEFAFQWFSWSIQNNCPLNAISGDTAAKLEKEVAVKIENLSGIQSEHRTLTDDERTEARSIARSMQIYFSAEHQKESIVASPMFQGCGFLDKCYGDLLVGNCLVEVKAGDRNFRSIDIRQILVYVALNKVSEQYDIEEVILLNPRRGIYFRAPIETICVEAGGHSSDDVLSEIIYFISGGGVSK